LPTALCITDNKTHINCYVSHLENLPYLDNSISGIFNLLLNLFQETNE